MTTAMSRMMRNLTSYMTQQLLITITITMVAQLLRRVNHIKHRSPQPTAITTAITMEVATISYNHLIVTIVVIMAIAVCKEVAVLRVGCNSQLRNTKVDSDR